MTRSTMSLTAHPLQDAHTTAVRIVMMDTLPGGSEMEVTFDLEQAEDFANILRDMAQSMTAKRNLAREEQSAAA